MKVAPWGMRDDERELVASMVRKLEEAWAELLALRVEVQDLRTRLEYVEARPPFPPPDPTDERPRHEPDL